MAKTIVALSFQSNLTKRVHQLFCLLMICITASISPLCAASSITVKSTDSIYQVFGNSGSALDDSTNAQWVTFTAGSTNHFNMSATGTISNCCTDRGPDGLAGSSTITGINGLSSASGDSQLPLLGVFLNETDPSGSSPPSTLVYDSTNPVDLAPLLGQVFYIGDGRTGFENSTGSLLAFTAPVTATRLYVGIADGFNNGPPTMYGDNSGTFIVEISQVPPITETVPMLGPPALVLLMCALLGSANLTMRRRPSQRAKEVGSG